MSPTENLVRKLLGKDFKGYACELGAFDGESFSTSLDLEREGWEVLCIEPQQEFEEYLRNRRKNVMICACADFRSEYYPFTVSNETSKASASALLLRWPGATVNKVTRVPVRLLDDCLSDAGFPRLDYLTLDVEGWEKEVLAGFTPAIWKPAVMAVECWKETDWLYELLEPLGFTDEATYDYSHVMVNKQRVEELRSM